MSEIELVCAEAKRFENWGAENEPQAIPDEITVTENESETVTN